MSEFSDRSLAEQFMDTCRHFVVPGLSGVCEKGVDYDDLTKTDLLGSRGSALRRPCIRRNHAEENRRGQPLCRCVHLSFYTLEEAKEKERSALASIKEALGR